MPHVEGGAARRVRKIAAALLLAGVAAGPLPGCRGIENLEPRERDPVPMQIGKGLLWVPAMIVCAGVLVCVGVAMGTAQTEGYDWETERASGRPDDDQDLGLRRPIWQ